MGRRVSAVQAFCPQDKTLAEGRLCRPEHFNPYGSPQNGTFCGPIPWPLSPLLWPATEILPQTLSAGPLGARFVLVPWPWNRPRGPIADGAARKRRTSVLSQDKTLAEGRLCRPEHFNPYGSPQNGNILRVLFHGHHHRCSGRQLRVLPQVLLAGPLGGPPFCAPSGAAGGFSRKIHPV